MPLTPIYEARLAHALRVIAASGIYAPDWAWIDRNLYERLIAEERRQGRRQRRGSWLPRQILFFVPA